MSPSPNCDQGRPNTTQPDSQASNSDATKNHTPTCVSALRLSLLSELKPANAPDQLQFYHDTDEELKGTGVYDSPQLVARAAHKIPAIEIATKRKGRETWAQDLGTGRGSNQQYRPIQNLDEHPAGPLDAMAAPPNPPTASLPIISATPIPTNADPEAFQTAILALPTRPAPIRKKKSSSSHTSAHRPSNTATPIRSQHAHLTSSGQVPHSQLHHPDTHPPYPTHPKRNPDPP